jgi:serine/threonine protein kinase
VRANFVQSEEGFCLVQEYIPAESLAGGRSLSVDQIQDIALQTLEILVYLQSLHPPILHRDIKPENLLYDGDKIHLVDFGLSRFGSENVANSSIMVGTIGFIPPEIFSGREPSKASDLYSLGATIICLFSGKSSLRLSELMGDDFSFGNKAFIGIPQPFSDWLKEMVAAKVSDRFTDAAEAIQEFEKIRQSSMSHQHAYQREEKSEERVFFHKGTAGHVSTEQFLAKSLPKWPKF